MKVFYNSFCTAAVVAHRLERLGMAVQGQWCQLSVAWRMIEHNTSVDAYLHAELALPPPVTKSQVTPWPEYWAPSNLRFVIHNHIQHCHDVLLFMLTNPQLQRLFVIYFRMGRKQLCSVTSHMPQVVPPPALF